MFDSADGWVARKTNRQDGFCFGKNIDSLSDIVSFGVAPATFLYCCINTTPGIFQIIVILILSKTNLIQKIICKLNK